MIHLQPGKEYHVHLVISANNIQSPIKETAVDEALGDALLNIGCELVQSYEYTEEEAE